MELTRRDAIIALTSIGAISGLYLGLKRHNGNNLEKDALASMQGIAEVLYPSEVTGVSEFVEEYLRGRSHLDNHISELNDTVTELNEAAISWYGASIPELTQEELDSLLQEIGSNTAEENPTGTTAERVRFYVVNELLLALYSSPVGGRLVGIENPQGHPGGTESYKHGYPVQ